MPAHSVALIAGASRGLGLLIARELGRRGYLPVLWARDRAELDGAAAILEAEGIACDAMVCDVRDEPRVRELVTEIEAQLGPIEAAITVAGVIQVGPLGSATRDQLTEAVDIMLWGPVNVSLAVLPLMRRRGRGRIGVVSSIGGLIAVPHLLPYCTAKFGAVGFTRALHAELAGTGITATTIAPGLMRTGSHLRAEFGGNSTAEYAWFAAGASLPLLSMDAERAAARIVTGVVRGRGSVILTPLAQVGARVGGLLPATTVGLMRLVSRLLPPAPDDPLRQGKTLDGAAAREQLGSSVENRLTTLGDRAAAANNELG